MKKYSKSKKNKDFIEIFGIHAVKAALKNNNRCNQQLIISNNLIDEFKIFKNRVNEIITLSNDQFRKIYGNEKNHQGVILKTIALTQPSIDNIILNSKKIKKN